MSNSQPRLRNFHLGGIYEQISKVAADNTEYKIHVVHVYYALGSGDLELTWFLTYNYLLKACLREQYLFLDKCELRAYIHNSLTLMKSI